MAYSPPDDPDPIPDYYASHAPRPIATVPLVGDHRCDVVVVGGGFTGLSTALHLAERGSDVMILESRDIGAGASSRNFGQIVPYLMPSHDAILASLPADVAERLIARVGEGPALVFSLIDRYAIACADRREGLLFGAHSPRGLATLEARTAFWQAREAPVAMYGASVTQALTGSAYYRASSVDYRGGTINPLGYVRGLAAAAAGLGCRVHTDSPARTVERSGTKWRVTLPQGSVTADSVVIATNAYTSAQLWPGLRESIIPVRGYQLVSAPLSDNLRRTVLPGGQPMTDTRRTHSGIRLHGDGRLHSSTLGPPFDTVGTPDVERLNRRVASVFPQLGALRWDYRWTGWIGLSRDHTPHLHELAPGVWTGLGYTGRGIAAATMMGRDIAASIAGPPAEETAFPVTRMARWWISRHARSVVGLGIAYHRLRDHLDERQAQRG